MTGRKLPTPRREREEWNVHPTFWLLKGLPEGLISVLPDSEHYGNSGVSWFGGGALRTKVSVTAYNSTRKTTVLQRDKRRNKKLWALENRNKTPSLGNYMHKPREDIPTEKV